MISGKICCESGLSRPVSRFKGVYFSSGVYKKNMCFGPEGCSHDVNDFSIIYNYDFAVF